LLEQATAKWLDECGTQQANGFRVRRLALQRIRMPPSLVFIVRVSDGAFCPKLPRSEPCKMAQGQSLVRVNPDRQRHLLHARSGGHRVPPAPSRRALKTREETMSGIWRSPALKRKSATRSGQRTTTSTPSIILDRCPRIQKERKSLCCDGHLRSGPSARDKGWACRLLQWSRQRRSDLLLLPRQSPLMADFVAEVV